MTEIHITSDKEVWTGASTTALLSAKQATDGIVLSAGNRDIIHRFRREGLEPIYCPMSGIFASLHISRALRHISGKSFEIYVHSPETFKSVESAIKLVGRQEPIILKSERPMPDFPKVEIAHPEKGSDFILMWLGNITANCELNELIEELAAKSNLPWRLRVVGQGKAKVVTPILKRAKALAIDNRIEWIGYSDNPYKNMSGVSAAIVKNLDGVTAHEFKAAGIPTFKKLSEII